MYWRERYNDAVLNGLILKMGVFGFSVYEAFWVALHKDIPTTLGVSHAGILGGRFVRGTVSFWWRNESVVSGKPTVLGKSSCSTNAPVRDLVRHVVFLPRNDIPSLYHRKVFYGRIKRVWADLLWCPAFGYLFFGFERRDTWIRCLWRGVNDSAWAIKSRLRKLVVTSILKHDYPHYDSMQYSNIICTSSNILWARFLPFVVDHILRTLTHLHFFIILALKKATQLFNSFFVLLPQTRLQ